MLFFFFCCIAFRRCYGDGKPQLEFFFVFFRQKNLPPRWQWSWTGQDYAFPASGERPDARPGRPVLPAQFSLPSFADGYLRRWSEDPTRAPERTRDAGVRAEANGTHRRRLS